MRPRTTVDTGVEAALDKRRREIVAEFGAYTVEELAGQAPCGQADREVAINDWKSDRRVFSVVGHDASGLDVELFLRFQFKDGAPLVVIERILHALGEGMDGWSIAFWFTSNNGALPGTSRPVDLLQSRPEEVFAAAAREGAASGA